MAKLTLLQMTQDILNDMDSDPVNSIDDTEESLQVAQVIKTTYYNFTSQRDWPFLRTKSGLEGLGDTDNPTQMKIPENTNKILWMKYNKKDVTYLEPKAFQDLIDGRQWGTSPVDANGYITDADPTYWTTFDDQYVRFDSYDLANDTTLQSSKSVALATVSPAWTMEDSFVPALPEKLFNTILAAAKATCFTVLKQTNNTAAESYASRGIIRAQSEAIKIKDGEEKSNRINYGRK